MRTMKFNKLKDSVQLIMKTEQDYFEIFFPMKAQYIEISAQELIEQCN